MSATGASAGFSSNVYNHKSELRYDSEASS